MSYPRIFSFPFKPGLFVALIKMNQEVTDIFLFIITLHYLEQCLINILNEGISEITLYLFVDHTPLSVTPSEWYTVQLSLDWGESG